MSAHDANKGYVATQIPGPPIARFFFADTRMAWFWLIVRVLVGAGWVAAGVSKVTGYAFGIRANGASWWFMANDGAAVKTFANVAINHGGAQAVPGFPDWVVGAPSWYASFLQSVVVPNAGVFAYLVAGWCRGRTQIGQNRGDATTEKLLF
jgi:thiosulfate dehydrogenase [quinone] large subunit